MLEKVPRLRVDEVVWKQGGVLQEGLRFMAARHPACLLTVGRTSAPPTKVFGLGPDTPLARALYIRKMGARGFLVSTRNYVILAHDGGKIQQVLAAADEAMSEIAELIANGKLAEESCVPRGLRGFARLA